MGAVDAGCELATDGAGDLRKLGGLDNLEDFLELRQVHHLLGAVHLGPILEQPEDDLQSGTGKWGAGQLEGRRREGKKGAKGRWGTRGWWCVRV